MIRPIASRRLSLVVAAFGLVLWCAAPACAQHMMGLADGSMHGFGGGGFSGLGGGGFGAGGFSGMHSLGPSYPSVIPMHSYGYGYPTHSLVPSYQPISPIVHPLDPVHPHTIQPLYPVHPLQPIHPVHPIQPINPPLTPLQPAQHHHHHVYPWWPYPWWYNPYGWWWPRDYYGPNWWIYYTQHFQWPYLGFYGHMDARGMVVDRVLADSLAWRIGLVAGDVIEKINGTEIRSEADYDQSLRSSGGHVRMVVWNVRTQGRETYVFNLNNHYGPQSGSARYYGPGGPVPPVPGQGGDQLHDAAPKSDDAPPPAVDDSGNASAVPEDASAK